MNSYPKAYVDYLIHFHAERDFFECHEVLEEFWKEHPEDPNSEAYVGLIQVAVSLYHQRRGNLAGAVKMLTSAIQRLDKERLERLGIDADKFRDVLQARLEECMDPVNFTYSDLDIPLKDETLNVLCGQACAYTNKIWGQPSDMNDTFLIHKHTLRDRTAVVAERELQKQLKLKQRMKKVNDEGEAK
ncbi:MULTISPECIES: DUF309 domain-containing protein [unclassified Paenibacillus]|uniref:DUF309 domain-containing protein n=1 Tax=unclassified Paenibacillus TaxID=185978 RepID=UPI001AE1196C|nr:MULTISPECIES: DUF309 domain-containing protein [unclassified Paenibacillus]MBP1155425.1 putative metal-dependent hydrolase [Paenibacillus sp. PvP091]MBP1169190.1 putative metal-dependent hydrolase [Paenibacillus sp. PvR098]MBP2440218.1 putative metal-dependent hydrolase [Paenibacillus sp. PvP052]